MIGQPVAVWWEETIEEATVTVGGPLAVTPEQRERARAALLAAAGGMEGLERIVEEAQAKRQNVDARKAKQVRARTRAKAQGGRQCRAKTRTGDRCTRVAAQGRRRCLQHLATATAPKRPAPRSVRRLADLAPAVGHS